METSWLVQAACPSTHQGFRPFGDWHVPCLYGSQFGAAPDAPLHRVKEMVNMNKLQQFIVWAGVVGGLAVAAPVGAAPISFVSGAGVAWTSENDAVCGGPAACGGSTVAITRNSSASFIGSCRVADSFGAPRRLGTSQRLAALGLCSRWW